jgi:hypothetical protein
MKKALSRLAAGVGLSVLLLTIAMARPVTTADLSGKTICWSGTMSGDDFATYLPGGKIVSGKFGEGTWQVTEAGVIIIHKYNFVADMQILPDGTITSATEGWGRTFLQRGHYCKAP